MNIRYISYYIFQVLPSSSGTRKGFSYEFYTTMHTPQGRDVSHFPNNYEYVSLDMKGTDERVYVH